MDNGKWVAELWLFAGYYYAESDHKVYEKFYKCSSKVEELTPVFNPEARTYLPKHRTLKKVVGGLYTVETRGEQVRTSSFCFLRKAVIPELASWETLSASAMLLAAKHRAERACAKELTGLEEALRPLKQHYRTANTAQRLAIEMALLQTLRNY